jgi:hypothetical protein
MPFPCTICGKDVTDTRVAAVRKARHPKIKKMPVWTCSQACQRRVPDRKTWEKLYAEGR